MTWAFSRSMCRYMHWCIFNCKISRGTKVLISEILYVKMVTLNTNASFGDHRSHSKNFISLKYVYFPCILSRIRSVIDDPRIPLYLNIFHVKSQKKVMSIFCTPNIFSPIQFFWANPPEYERVNVLVLWARRIKLYR